MKNIFWIFFCFLAVSSIPGNFSQKGTASYYSAKMNGRGTYSGERFHSDSLTAAHKTLPMGTFVKITNLNNDSTVVVKINDRMGKSSPHCIDVTLAAARKLNFVGKGIAKVLVEEIELLPVTQDTLTQIPSEK